MSEQNNLDDGTAHTFVSATRDEVSFALIDFRDWMEKSRMPQAGRYCSRCKGIGNTNVQFCGLIHP